MTDLRNGWDAESTKRLPISSRRPVRHDERGVRDGIWAGLLRWIPLTPLLLMLTVSGQQPPAPGPRAYDVCSVKPSTDDAHSTIFPTAGNGFTAVSQSVESLIELALDRRWFEVFGLPAWAKHDYYDVACKDTEGESLKEPSLPRMRSGPRNQTSPGYGLKAGQWRFQVNAVEDQRLRGPWVWPDRHQREGVEHGRTAQGGY